MIHELDSIVLAEDLPEYNLKRGNIGTIVLAPRGGAVLCQADRSMSFRIAADRFASSERRNLA
jgi:hypothetical protein